MKVTDLMPGDMLDLANLNLPGASGVMAECELARIEELIREESAVYTDLVNISVSFDAPLIAQGVGQYAFADPKSLASWTW